MTANCTISIANFGRARVRALRVVHGMSVVAYAGEDQSRAGNAFYPSKRTSGSFELTLVFSRDQGYREIMEWLQRYQRWAGNPKTKATACRVTIPSRHFDKIGVLESGVTFGDDVRDVTHKVTLAFAGSSDPLDFKGNQSVVSQFKKARSKDPALPYFYPGGQQLKGKSMGWDTIYDIDPDEVIMGDPDTIASPGGGFKPGLQEGL